MIFMAKIRIECVIENKFGAHLICLELAKSSTAADALKLLNLDASNFILSIWSKRIDPSVILNDGDRLELNRPLQKNPLSRLSER